MTQKTVKCAVIGLGQIGAQFDFDPLRPYPSSHVGAFSSIPGAKIIAVADVDKEKLRRVQERWKIPHVYTDYIAMLDKEKLDVVSVCVPTHLHEKIVTDVAEKNVKVILCEKPIASSIEEAERMIYSCRKHGIKLAVNHTRRWDSTYRQVKKAITQGLIGEISFICGFHPSPLLRSGVHMLDLFNYYIGRLPIQVYGYANRENWIIRKYPSSNDYSCSALILYKDNLYVFFEGALSRNYDIFFEIDIQGSNGRFRIEDNGRTVNFWQSEKSKYYLNLTELRPKHFHIEKSSLTPMQAVAFNIVSAAENPDVNVLCSGEDAKTALELAIAIHMAAIQEKTVNLPVNDKKYRILSF